MAETRAAMDLLEEIREARSFVLGGLCSGASVAFKAAREDTRAVGLLQMDGFAYPTARFHLNRIRSRLAQPSTWPASARARTRGFIERFRPRTTGEDAAALIPSGYERTFPPRADTAQGLRELCDRGVPFYHFFSGGHRPYLNYAEQYADAFPEVDFGDLLHVHFLPEADHTLTNLQHQRALILGILDWAGTHWPAQRPRVERIDAASPKETRRPMPTGADR